MTKIAPSYRLIKAELKHIDAIVELWTKLMKLHKEMDHPFFSESDSHLDSYKDQLKGDLNSEDHLIVLLLMGNNVKGYVTASLNQGGVFGIYNSLRFCEIGDIMIDNEIQQKGLGELLINEVKQWAKIHQTDRTSISGKTRIGFRIE